MRKSLMVLVAVVAVVVLALSAFQLYEFYIGKQDQSGVSGEAPDASEDTISLLDLDTRLLVMGGATKKLSEYSEGILFLNFWATWCGYCEMEMPDLIKLDKQLRAEGIGKVLAIDVNEKESVVKDYLQEMGFTEIEVLLDTDGAAAKKFDIEGYPTTFVFKDGDLIDQQVGMMSWDDMLAMLEAAR